MTWYLWIMLFELILMVAFCLLWRYEVKKDMEKKEHGQEIKKEIKDIKSAPIVNNADDLINKFKSL